MMRVLIPLCLLLAGLGAGIAAGLALRPAAQAAERQGVNAADAGAPPATAAPPAVPEDNLPAGSDGSEFIRLNNQFVVPLMQRDTVGALVVMSLSLEVRAGQSQLIYAREPKLRDAFLQVLFDHANRGGFEGDFTNARNMDALRQALGEVARRIIGDAVSAVLITEIARQDV